MLSQQFNQLIHDYRAVLFLTVCLAGQILAWRLWLRQAGSRPGLRRLIHGAFIIFNIGWAFTVFTLYHGRNLTDTFLTWVVRPSVSWQTVHLLVIVPAAALGSLVLSGLRRLFRGRAAEGEGPADPGRRDFLVKAGAVGGLAVLGVSGYGVYRQGRSPALVRQTVLSPGLPSDLDGFVIAQITDVHLGLWASQAELDQALALLAAEKPDLAVFTGDLVDRDPEYARLYYEPLRHLADTPHGVWGILGNHDHYTGPEKITRLLDGNGLSMLVDRRVNLPNAPVTLIGLDDRGIHHNWMGADSPSLEDKEDPDVLDFKKVSGPPPRSGDFTILLNHRPEGFRQAAAHGCGLYLAGHTHGGQYQLPGHDQLNLAGAFYKYTTGLYHEHGAHLYVSRGLAAVGIPFRLWAWPEVNLITLRAAP